MNKFELELSIETLNKTIKELENDKELLDNEIINLKQSKSKLEAELYIENLI